jgi:adenylyltransferase/sulfurtransferase
MYLTLAGVGRLRLVDLDTVEEHNLHRQVLYDGGDIRFPKVEAAEKRIHAVNPDVEIQAIPDNITSANVEELLAGADCVVDGLDNMRTRYLLNRAAIRNKVPYIFGGAIGMEGNLSVFQPPETACLECIMPGLSDDRMPTCDVRGVLGATTGIIGSLQAMEAVKVLANIGHPLRGRLVLFDFYQMKCLETEVRPRAGCEACGTNRPNIKADEELPTWLCGKNTISVNPPTALTIDLSRAEAIFGRTHEILLHSGMAVVLRVNSKEVTVFSKGRILIKNVDDERLALSIARGLLEEIREAIRYN